MKRRLFLSAMIFSLMILAVIPTSTIADDAEKGGLFPTKKESTVRINVTLQHDGLDIDKQVPTLSFNKTYTLKIDIGVVELGKDAQDIHDIAILSEITRTNFLGSKTYYHSGLYTDSTEKLKQGENTTIYVKFMPVGTGERITDAELIVQISVKEAVSLNIDPTTEFTPFNYAVVLNPNEEVNPITSYDDGDTIQRSVIEYTAKESQINFTLVVGVDNVNNDTGKPTISTYKKYSLYFYFKVLKLGTDADDVHDVDISIFLEEQSVKDYFPGSSTKKYFAMNLVSNKTMAEGDSIELYSAFFVSSNSNDTTVQFKTTVQVKEAVSLSIDPTSKIADFSVEMKLNPSSNTSSSGAPLQGIPFFLVILAIPVILRKRLKSF